MLVPKGIEIVHYPPTKDRLDYTRKQHSYATYLAFQAYLHMPMRNHSRGVPVHALKRSIGFFAQAVKEFSPAMSKIMHTFVPRLSPDRFLIRYIAYLPDRLIAVK